MTGKDVLTLLLCTFGYDRNIQITCERLGYDEPFYDIYAENKDGDEYEMDADCPVCEGTGRTIEEKEVPTGRMIPEKKTNIDMAGIRYEAKYIKNAIDGLRLLGFDSIRQVRRTEEGANVFEVTAGVEVWIAPMFKNADWSEYKTAEVCL